MTGSHRRVRVVSLALASASVLVLLGRAGFREARPEQSNAPASVYDPVAYYQLVNEEVVEHLRFCPLYADPSQARAGEDALSRAAQLQFSLASEAAADRIPTTAECTNCDAEGRRLTGLFCLSEDAAAPDGPGSRITRFAEMSPLAADMSAPDRWDHGPDGKVLRLHGGIHKQRLPDPGSHHVLDYRGSLLYRASSTHKVLIDGAGNERILGGGEEPVDLTRWRNEQTGTDADGRLQRTSHSLPLVLGGATIEDLPEMPDRIALVVHQQSGRRVLVDGAPIDQSVRSVLAIDRGQVIEIEVDAGDPLRLRLAGARTGTLSTRRVTADGKRREIDPESGLEDLVTGLVAAVEGTLGRANDTWNLRENREAGSDHDPVRLAEADITLSIDRSLQLQAVDSLDRFATSPTAEHNAARRAPHYRDHLWWDGGPKRDLPLPFPQMTLTIIDADNGDLLAMAAYPSKRAIDQGLEAVAASEGEGLLTGGPARLLREQLQQELGRTSLHLRPHPIGSIFKPFFAWAAGNADSQLLEFELHARPRDWEFANLDGNRELERCLISGRRVEGDGSSHRKNAYASWKDPQWSCDRGLSGGEDVCAALAMSDTYYFLELMARVQTVGRGDPLPPAGASDSERDQSYGLPGMCGRQWVYPAEGKPVGTCNTEPRVSGVELLPPSCGSTDTRPICAIVRDLGVQLQETNHANDPGSASIDGYLGPLATELIQGLAADSPDGCSGREKLLLDGFRWAVPLPPQWPHNLMQSCTPDLEAFMEGGGLNYWNDVHVVQTFARLFTDQRELQARLVLAAGSDAPTLSVVEGKPVALDCPEGAAPTRCRVLRGLLGAVEVGTLKTVGPLAEALTTPGFEVTVRGKTGTTRAPFPTFKPPERKRGWVHGMSARKSIHTALLIEVSDGKDRARHYVIYLSMNGVDEELVSRHAASFFQAKNPGYSVLDRLVSGAVLDLTEAGP